jgi:hypothetical protein
VDDPDYFEFFRTRPSYKFMMSGVQTSSPTPHFPRKWGVGLFHSTEGYPILNNKFKSPICQEELYIEDDIIEHHHFKPRYDGVNDLLPNLLLLHGSCHRSIHADQYKIKWYTKLLEYKGNNPIISTLEFHNSEQTPHL